MKKIVAWVAVGLVALVGVLAIIPFAVDLNKYHDTILKRIKPYVNRQVDFTGIRLTILSGLGAELQGLRVLDDPAFAKDTFLAAETVQLKVALLPLLKKKIMVRAVVLKAPLVNVIRAADGTYNFQHMLVPQPEKEEQKGKPSIASTLLIRLIEVKDGRFSYLDLKPGAKKQAFVVDAIDLKAHEVSLFRPITLDLKAAVMSSKKDQNLMVEGTIGPLNLGGAKASPLMLTASLTELPLSALPVQSPWPSGKASFRLDAKGSLTEKVDIKADLQLTGLGSKPRASKENLNCTLTTSMQLDYPQERLQISSGAIDLGGDQGSFSGGVDQLRTAPAWNMTLSFARLNLDVLIAALPMLAKKVPPALSLNGPAGLTIVSTGTAQAFKISTATDFSQMGIAYGKVFAKPGGISFNFKNTTTFQKGLIDVPSMVVVLDQIKATINGQINTTDQGKSSYRFVMQSDNLGLEKAARLVPALASFKPTGTLKVQGEMSGGNNPMAMKVRATSKTLAFTLSKAQAQATQNKMLSGPMRAQLGDIDLELTADKPAQGLKAAGNLGSRQGSLMNIAYRNLKTAFGFENQRVTVRSLTFDVFKGSISSSAAYNLKDGQWQAAPKITNVQAGNVLDIFSTSSGVFSGSLTGAAEASGGGGGAALKGLNAESDFKLSQGEWRNFDLSKTALGSLLAIPGFSQIVGISEQDVQAYKSTRFDSLAAKLTIEKGILTVSDLAMTGIRAGSDQDATARLKGTLDLTTRELALKGSFGLPKRLSQRMVKKNKAMQNLTDETQRVALPLKVGGTLQKPAPAVDTRTIQKALAGYYADKAVEEGLKKIQEKTGAGKEVEQLMKGRLNR
ncbi:MAG: AsmA family protein [Syntrophaceae bacterium]